MVIYYRTRKKLASINMVVTYVRCSALWDESRATSYDQSPFSSNEHLIAISCFQEDDRSFMAERFCCGPICTPSASCGIGCMGGGA